MQYPVIFEKCENNYSAYVPDLPGCIAVGNSLEEIKESIAEAIEFHIEALREAGYTVPAPSVQNHPTVAKNKKGENDEQRNE